ncbi:hypothetical protein [Sphaerobacter thermophilus]|uniref:hypothetical protein n=1 Tax=Sphaerobacter thermophilus TaxID=2057 RepID=UPI0039C49C34
MNGTSATGIPHLQVWGGSQLARLEQFNLSSDLAEYIVADIRHHGLTAHLRDLGEGARQ